MSSVDLTEVATSTFDDVPDDVEVVNGTYVFEVTKTKLEQTGGDESKPYIGLTLKVVEVLETDEGEKELTDDDIPNMFPVREKLFISTAAKKYTKRILETAFGVTTEEKSMAEIAEELLGQQVKGIVEVNESTKNNVTRRYPNVQKYLPVT